MKKILNNKYIRFGLALSVGMLLGWFIKPSNHRTITSSAHQHIDESNHHTIIPSNNQSWTCSMHPQIKRNEPGQCPICGMELIPLSADEKGQNPMAVSMSSTAMKLANVQTMIVSSGDAEKSIRLNGKIQADERMLFTQSTHIPGRIEELRVNFTGEYVSKGQVIAKVYSPDLVTAQKELFEAQKIQESQPALYNAAKGKLKNWKLSDQQINNILTSGKSIDQFPVLANASGYVTQKLVNLGDYIKLGQPIYEIADFSKVWILFDVYESDMRWIHKGDKITFEIQSLPGEAFHGNISYLDPVIDLKTRVAKARVEVRNTEQKLKPEMFVSGILATAPKGKGNSIVVPKSAVMWTGKRSVVYVKNTTDQGISFMMQEVTLGAELGDGFVIKSGLQSGEEIAINGTFSIDAAAQLDGKPSMMNPEGGVAMTGHNHGKMFDNSMKKPSTESVQKTEISSEAKMALTPIFQSYFEMKNALTADDFAKAQNSGKSMRKELATINMSLFTGNSHGIWMDYSSKLSNALQHIDHLTTIDALRKDFMSVSTAMIGISESFHPMNEILYVQHCPMANTNKGADWLSEEKEIINPYFGQAMLSCGETTKTIQ